MYPKDLKRWCFVPRCKNTSRNAPHKIFVSVPAAYERKVLWFKAARRALPKSSTKFYCCEDHFNLEEDMKNYMRFKIMGGHIIMKPDVVPHKFDCQINSVPDICTSRKRGHRKLLLDEVGDDNALGVASASAAIPLGRPKLVDDAVPSIFPPRNKDKDARTTNTQQPTTPRFILPKKEEEEDISEEIVVVKHEVDDNTIVIENPQANSEDIVTAQQKPTSDTTNLIYSIPETVTHKIFADNSALVLPADSWTVHTLEDCVVFFQLAATCNGNVIMTKKFIIRHGSLKCFIMERHCNIRNVIFNALHKTEIETIADLQTVLNGFSELRV